MSKTDEQDEDEAKRMFTARPKVRRMRHIPTPPPLSRRVESPVIEPELPDAGPPEVPTGEE